MSNTSLTNSPLGKKNSYASVADIDTKLLFPVARDIQRQELEILDWSNIHGEDIWHAYETSWLSSSKADYGMPRVGILEFKLAQNSKLLIESKSLKLYLNSFNYAKFASLEEIANRIHLDLVKILQITNDELKLKIYPLESYKNKCINISAINESFQNYNNFNLDAQNFVIDNYSCDSDKFLEICQKLHKPRAETKTKEVCFSDLLKSNCLITQQPDWGSIVIAYEGSSLNKQALLAYIISFRDHNEFHESLVERIFSFLFSLDFINELLVAAFYTRRGGIDINPIRSSSKKLLQELGDSKRFIRQ